MFLITTTGTTASVTFGDLGDRTFSHPTTGVDLELEYDIFDLINSNDVQGSIDLGYITVSDGTNAIIDLSNYFMPTHIYDSNSDNIVDDSTTLFGSSASFYLDANNLTGSINNSVVSNTGLVDSVNSKTGSVVLNTGDILENTNLYYTDTRARNSIGVSASSSNYLNYDSNTGLFNMTPLSITDVTVDSVVVSSVDYFSVNYTGTEFQEGDTIILTAITSGTEIFMHNGGTAGASTDFTLIENPDITDSYVRGLISGATGINYNSALGEISANINDSSNSLTELWSSNKIQSSINNISLSNTVIVNFLSDLPTPSGGKITLLPAKKYFFTTPINLGTDYLELGNGTVLDSINHLLTTITYTGTGAALRGTNINCTIREIKVDGAAQGFAFRGTGAEVVSVFQSTFDNCTKIGTVDAMFAFFYKNNNHQGNTDGLTITDSVGGGNYIFSALTFSSTNTGSFINILSGTYNGIRIETCNMEVPLGSIGLNINELSIIISGIFVLKGNMLLGASTTKISNFNPLNGDIKSDTNTGFKNNTPHSSITSTEMFGIISPTVGLPFFNTDLNSLVYWDGVKWDKLADTQIFMEQLVNDFELGVGAFIFINNGINDWVVGTAAPSTGLQSMYISDDGGATTNYSASGGGGTVISHAYLDVLLPISTINLAIQFDWKCEAEIGYDWGELHDVTTATTPVVDVALGVTGQIGLTNYNNQLGFTTAQVNIPTSEAGTTRRFVWSFLSDYTVQNPPAFVVDNIKIIYL